MDDTTLKISLAGLMHDVGKFADKDVLAVDEGYIDRNQALYCRSSKDGRYTHYHALWTAAFIENKADWLPAELNASEWGQGDAFINLAAMHHKPESALQWIVTTADRISSGLDRDEFEDESSRIPWREYRKTRLFPLFEQLNMNGTGDEFQRDAAKWRYPLARVSHESIFPELKKEVTPRDDQAAKAEYQKLFDDFRKELAGLRHRNENIELWYEHFDSLLMLYTTNIPSARAGNVIPDVSLYDHSRTTAALTAALYLYHRDSGSLTEDSVKNDEQQKFLLISGDFYGIQDFIFSTHGDTRKYRSKLLRGRSFMVSLLTELAADMICRQIGLPPTSVVINAGGKFTILAPNTEAAGDAAKKAEQKINEWLIRLSYGQNSLGLSTLPASPRDFNRNRFHQLWEQLNIKIAGQKFNRIDLDKYGGVVTGYLESFDSALARPLCPLCGKRPSEKRVLQSDYLRLSEVDVACAVCRDQIFLGANLVKKPHLAVVEKDTLPPDSDRGLFVPVFDEYQVQFVAHDKEGPIKTENVIRCWDLEYVFSKDERPEVAVKFINGYVPRFEEGESEDPRFDGLKEKIVPGDPKTFGHIAALARNPLLDRQGFCGIEAIGALKADVDDLGRLMAFGLEKKSLTVSRQATLSRQLDFFFSVYLPYMLQSDSRFMNIYTVFAGGDDLFLIGPWNRIIELVEKLDADFGRYVCKNPCVHFSAGITLFKPSTPIDAIAEVVEKELESSKAAEKHRLTLFGETVRMEDYSQLLDIGKTLDEWLNKEWISRVMLYRLGELIGMAAMEKRLIAAGGDIKIEDLACLRWRALLAYSVSRNIGKDLKKEERSQAAARVHEDLGCWIEQYGSALKIPLWNILYNTRR